MAKRKKLDAPTGPDREKVNQSWMPGNRLGLDFIKCGPSVVTKIFTHAKTETAHVEVSYDPQSP